MNSADREWLKTRRGLLRAVKAAVKRRLGDDPTDLRNYEREARRLARSRYRVSSKSEILAEIEAADIVYGGDFHAHGPAQRTHFKILRHLALDRTVVLALECFDSRAQKHLELFLRKRIDAERLRKLTRWDERWGFPWENYRALLELARRRGWQLEAIGVAHGVTLGQGGLSRQDVHTAKQLKSMLVRHPGALVYVVIGELHLTHLPGLLAKEFPRLHKPREVAIHLNVESVYFELAAKGLENSVDVIRYAPKQRPSPKRALATETITRFGVISSPPWVPWQSYLLHLDKTAELEWSDFGETEEDFDPTDNVRGLIDWIAGDVGLEIDSAEFSVYSAADPRLWRRIDSALKKKEREIARRLLIQGRSFVLPGLNVGCLAQATINHAAHLAGEYVQISASRRSRVAWSFPKDFEAAIFVEGLAYFGSKLINHKRQAETIHDLRSELQGIPATDEGRDALRLALDQRMTELVYFHQGRKRKRLVRPTRAASYLEAALILGRMFGERLYGAFRARKISKREIVRFYQMDVLRRDFGREYDASVARLAKVVGTEIAPSGWIQQQLKGRRERL